MTSKMTKMVVKSYESPVCDIVEMQSEGVLCGSMEQLKEYDDVFEW